MLHPQRALSLTAAGAGSGSERKGSKAFARTRWKPRHVREEGLRTVAHTYGMGQARIPFLVKDPRGFEEFTAMFGEHDAKGSANTMRGFQGERPRSTISKRR